MTVGRAEFGPVRLAWVDAAAASLTTEMLAPFGEQQRRRHAALNGAAAQRFLAGRWLLGTLVAERHPGADVTLISMCERCGGDHGRPRLLHVPLEVSLSYAGDVVAVAVAAREDASAVGVDIERMPSAGARHPLRELAPLFAPAAPPSTEEWTLLEAALKADGRGVVGDLSGVRLGEGASGAPPGSRTVSIPGRADRVDAAVVTGPEGHLLSAAVARPGPSSAGG